MPSIKDLEPLVAEPREDLSVEYKDWLDLTVNEHKATLAKAAIAGRMAEKLWRLRIFDDEQSAEQLNAPMLVISQFTLYADTRKGRRPSWSAAAPRSVSEPLVGSFVDALQALGAEVATGIFGAHMAVQLVNDGPVTLILESANGGA